MIESGVSLLSRHSQRSYSESWCHGVESAKPMIERGVALKRFISLASIEIELFRLAAVLTGAVTTAICTDFNLASSSSQALAAKFGEVIAADSARNLAGDVTNVIFHLVPKHNITVTSSESLLNQIMVGWPQCWFASM